MHKLDPRSEVNLIGVDHDLVMIVRAAHAGMLDDSPGLSFVVIDGLRTQEEQRALVAAGASRTMNSYHLTGRAVDLMATVRDRGDVNDVDLYKRLKRRMFAVAAELGHTLTWGGDWDADGLSEDERFFDGFHFQLEP